MHYSEEFPWVRDDIFEALEIPYVEDRGEDPDRRDFVISLCNVDLPCRVANGTVYVQAPLESVVDAFTAAIFEMLRDLENGISEARSSALSFASFRRTLRAEGVVITNVVRNGGLE